MSGPDQGDGDKSFLARWSQRKQEAKQPEPKPDAPAAEASAPEPVAEAGPEFDLSSLPKLDELTSTTDITGFLRKGVPEHLRNAALRKSWALDPAIRNYVNPAMEYAYDWNTPGGVPGSGELGAGVDVARMVLQIMGDDKPAAEREPVSDPRPDPADDPEVGPEALAASQSDLATDALRRPDDGRSVAQNAAIQSRPAEHESAALQPALRRHGSAKPVV